MTSNQIAYAKVLEDSRNHRAVEANAEEANRIAAENARINAINAETNIRNAAVNAQNAEINSRNADTNAYNAETNRFKVEVDSRNADTNLLNAATRQSELALAQQEFMESVVHNRNTESIARDQISVQQWKDTQTVSREKWKDSFDAKMRAKEYALQQREQNRKAIETGSKLVTQVGTLLNAGLKLAGLIG